MDWIKFTLFLSLLAASAYAQTREERLANKRLPGDLRPYHYNVELQPDIYNENVQVHNYSGVVEIFIQCVTVTNLVYINVKDYAPDRDSLAMSVASENNVTAPEPVIASATVYPDDEFYVISLESNLVLGARYRLSVTFRRDLSTNNRGFFQLSYRANFQTRWMAATRFIASDARAAFPCFDEPEYKATFDLVLLRKIEYRTVANMNTYRQDPRPDNWIADVYERTPVMSTHTLSFAVCDFQYRERVTTRGVVTRIWSRADQVIHTQRASAFGVELMQWYEQYLGINYPLTKMDHLAIPFDDGILISVGFGLVIYSERVLMYHEAESDINNLLLTYTGLSHEISRQWFGALVTGRWWDDLWLAVGFATFFNYEPFQELLNWPGFELQQTITVRDALRRDASPFSPAVVTQRNTPQDGIRAFNRLAYDKGASFLRMFRNAVLPETFQAALQKFLSRFQYGTATTEDLWTVFQEQVDEYGVTEPDGQTRLLVKEKFDPWVRQAGYPVVSFDRSTPSGGILARLNQTRFLMFMDDTPNVTSPYNYQWWVPISHLHEDQSSKTRLTQFYLPPDTGLDVTNMTSGLPVASKRLVVNVDRVGYYRVEYDEASRDQLRNALQEGQAAIPTENRAVLLDDMFRINRAFRMPETEALNFTLSLAQENQLLPWRVLVDSIGYQQVMFQRETVYGDHERYWRARIDPVYERNRFVQEEDIIRRMLRQIASYWSCSYNNAACIQRAVTAFNDWWINPITKPIEADQQLNYMCMAVRAGEEFEWNVVYALFRAFGSYRTRERYLVALACSRQYYILERYMVAMEDGDIPGLGAIYLSFNTLGTEIVWRHLRDRWANSPFTSFQKRSMLVANGVSRNRPEELEEFDDFVANNPPLDEQEERTFNFTRRLIENNVRWMALNQQPIQTWLSENAPPPSDDSPGTQAAGGGLSLMGYAVHMHLEQLKMKQATGQLVADLTVDDLLIEAVQDLIPNVLY